MIKAVQDFCSRTGQQVPLTVGEIAAVIYNSLAKCYGDTVKEIEAITGNTYDTIYVVGGGANAGYLNELTAKYTGKKVSAGPTEATAIGNVTVQMMHDLSLIHISPAFVGRRQQHFCMRAEVWLDAEPQGLQERAGLTVYHTNEHHYDLAVSCREEKRCVIPVSYTHLSF